MIELCYVRAALLTSALLPGVQLRLGGILVGLGIHISVGAHGVSKLVEQSVRLRLPTT